MEHPGSSTSSRLGEPATSAQNLYNTGADSVASRDQSDWDFGYFFNRRNKFPTRRGKDPCARCSIEHPLFFSGNYKKEDISRWRDLFPGCRLYRSLIRI